MRNTLCVRGCQRCHIDSALAEADYCHALARENIRRPYLAFRHDAAHEVCGAWPGWSQLVLSVLTNRNDRIVKFERFEPATMHDIEHPTIRLLAHCDHRTA